MSPAKNIKEDKLKKEFNIFKKIIKLDTENIAKYFNALPKPPQSFLGDDIINNYFIKKFLKNQLEELFNMIIAMIDANKERLSKIIVKKNKYAFSDANYILNKEKLSSNPENDFNSIFESKNIKKLVDMVKEFQINNGIINIYELKSKPFFYKLFMNNYYNNDKEFSDKVFYSNLFKQYNKIRDNLMIDIDKNFGILSFKEFIEKPLILKPIEHKENVNSLNNFINSYKYEKVGIKNNNKNDAEKCEVVENFIVKLIDDIINKNNSKRNTTTKYLKSNPDSWIDDYKRFIKDQKKNNGLSKIDIDKCLTKFSWKIPAINDEDDEDEFLNMSFYQTPLNINSSINKHKERVMKIFNLMYENLYPIVTEQKGINLYTYLLRAVKLDYYSILFFYNYIGLKRYQIALQVRDKTNNYIYNNIMLYQQYKQSFLVWRKDYVNNLPPNNNDKTKNSFGYYDEMFDKFLEHYFDGFDKIKENLIANYNTISKYSNQFKKIKDKKSALANLPL
jgi:hypothetical protein